MCDHLDAILNEMLMSMRRQSKHPTIIIDGSALLLDHTLSVDRFWAPTSGAAAQLQHIAIQAVNTIGGAIDHALTATMPAPRQYTPVTEFAFTHQQGMSGALWHAGADYSLAIKGLPEQVLEHCDMTDNEREAATLEIQKLSSGGASIIAVAYATLPGPISSLSELQGRALLFGGLVSLTSSIPGDIRELIRQARAHGVSLHLVTGTHVQTAFAIATQFGIATHPNEICDARQLHVTPESVQQKMVFARATPEHKTYILNALRAANSDVIVVTTKQELKAALTITPPGR